MPIYLRLFSCLSLSLGLMLSSYSPKAGTARNWKDPLSKQWVLRTLDGSAVPASLNVPAATAGLFRANAGSARRQLAGPRYQGTFTHTLSSRLRTFAQVITTLMKSDGAALNMELRYLTALEQATYYTIAGSTLSLFDRKNAPPRVTFEAAQ